MTNITITRPATHTTVISFKHALLAEPWSITVQDYRTDAGPYSVVHEAIEKVILMVSDQRLEADIKRAAPSRWNDYAKRTLVSVDDKALEVKDGVKSGTVVVSLTHRLLKTPLNVPVEVSGRRAAQEALYAVYVLLDRFHHEATLLQLDVRGRSVVVPDVESAS